MLISKFRGVGRCMSLALLAFSLSNSTVAGDYEWVQPDAYTFGNCGGVGGDSVPGLLNQKYFSRYQCRQTFDANKCDTQARWYEGYLNDKGISSCGAWLRQELSSCRSAVRASAQLCDELAK